MGNSLYVRAVKTMVERHRQERHDLEARSDSAQLELNRKRLAARRGLEAQQQYEFLAIRERHGFKLGRGERAIVDDPRAFVLGAQGVKLRGGG